jgi:hypothetical protein
MRDDLRSSFVAAVCAALVACDRADLPSSQAPPEGSTVSREQIAETMQCVRRQMEEFESANGPRMRATVERGGCAVLMASPASPTSRSFYSVQSRLAGDSEVSVLVPDSVPLTNGTTIDVVQGQYGYYFRSPCCA